MEPKISGTNSSYTTQENSTLTDAKVDGRSIHTTNAATTLPPQKPDANLNVKGSKVRGVSVHSNTNSIFKLADAIVNLSSEKHKEIDIGFLKRVKIFCAKILSSFSSKNSVLISTLRNMFSEEDGAKLEKAIRADYGNDQLVLDGLIQITKPTPSEVIKHLDESKDVYGENGKIDYLKKVFHQCLELNQKDRKAYLDSLEQALAPNLNKNGLYINVFSYVLDKISKFSGEDKVAYEKTIDSLDLCNQLTDKFTDADYTAHRSSGLESLVSMALVSMALRDFSENSNIRQILSDPRIPDLLNDENLKKELLEKIGKTSSEPSINPNKIDITPSEVIKHLDEIKDVYGENGKIDYLKKVFHQCLELNQKDRKAYLDSLEQALAPNLNKNGLYINVFSYVLDKISKFSGEDKVAYEKTIDSLDLCNQLTDKFTDADYTAHRSSGLESLVSMALVSMALRDFSENSNIRQILSDPRIPDLLNNENLKKELLEKIGAAQ